MSTTKVFVVMAEHQSYIGMLLSVHSSMEGAVLAAVDALSTMVKDIRDLGYDTNDVAAPTTENWRDVVAQLQDIHGAQYLYVEITEKEVQS